MRMGDWIMFRGRRRFVLGVRGSGVVLERVRGSPFPGPYVYYSASALEKSVTTVVKPSTVRARARARKLLESDLPAWTTIVWEGDTPLYVHDERRFP